jgi:hypothetical protein
VLIRKADAAGSKPGARTLITQFSYAKKLRDANRARRPAARVAGRCGFPAVVGRRNYYATLDGEVREVLLLLWARQTIRRDCFSSEIHHRGLWELGRRSREGAGRIAGTKVSREKRRELRAAQRPTESPGRKNAKC